MMTSRERALDALNHRSGPVPIDFGSTPITGMHCSCVAALRDHYGLEKRPVKVHEPYQMLGWVEADLLDAIGVDFVGMEAASTMFGFPAENWKLWDTPWGQAVLVPEQFKTVSNDEGTFIFPKGDTTVPPSGHMPKSGFFFDTIIRQREFDEDDPDPEDNLEEFQPLTENEIAFIENAAQRAAATGRVVVCGLGGTGLGDIASVPAPFMTAPKGIRDIEEWYMSTAIRQDFIHEIFSKQSDIAIENLKAVHAKAGDLIDVIMLCGTDFGTQTSSFCSPVTFDELWLPYYQKMNQWIHRNTHWKTFKHSCGAVENFMAHFIDAGFDIINPVQCSATGMDPHRLKERYGDRLVFWGGGVDTQRVLPFGDPAQVCNQVLERCEIFSKNGGYVFDAIHNVQAMTPTENMVAMIDAVKAFNGR